jgi:hypothetical protein
MSAQVQYKDLEIGLQAEIPTGEVKNRYLHVFLPILPPAGMRARGVAAKKPAETYL